MKKKKLTPTNGAQSEELLAVIQIALYDLSVLGRHDPLYEPRCKNRAIKVIREITGIKNWKPLEVN